MSNCDYTYSQVKNGTGTYRYESPTIYSAGVLTLQSRLRDCGYDITADGHFGSGTRLAVRRFQQCIYGPTSSHVDGIVGQNTLTQLDAVYNTLAFKYGASLCSTPSSWTRTQLASSSWNTYSKRIDALARVIWGEDNYSNNSRAAVARVIYNRANSSDSSFRRSGVSNKWLAVLSKDNQYSTVPGSAWPCDTGDSYDNWPSNGTKQRVLMPRRGTSSGNYINSGWAHAANLAYALENGSSITTQPGYPVTISGNGSVSIGNSATATLTSNHLYQIGRSKLDEWKNNSNYRMSNIITYDTSLNGNFFLILE